MNSPQAAHQIAAELAHNQAVRTPTAEGAGKVLRKLRVIADEGFNEVIAAARERSVEVDCKPGCDFCCHEPVPVAYYEIVDLAVKVRQKFSQEQRDALADRAIGYRAIRNEGKLVAPCPFLLEGLCSVYEDRPLICRGRHSVDVRACQARLTGRQVPRPGSPEYTTMCEAMMDGLYRGVPGRSFSEWFELGVWAEHIADGADPGSYILDALASPSGSPVRGDEPTGTQDKMPPEMRSFAQRRSENDISGAIAGLSSLGTTQRLLMSFWLPLAYESQDLMLEWQALSERALQDLEEHDIDAAAAFNMLPWHTTYAIGYQTLPIKDRLQRFGRFIHDKVVAPAVPRPRRPYRARA